MKDIKVVKAHRIPVIYEGKYKFYVIANRKEYTCYLATLSSDLVFEGFVSSIPDDNGKIYKNITGSVLADEIKLVCHSYKENNPIQTKHI